MTIRRLLAGTLTATVLLTAGCSSGGSATADGSAAENLTADDAAGENATPGAAGIRLVTTQEGADIQANPPNDLVILDVRTPEEFAEGHLEGAILLDFYEGDFADQLATLDPDVPYLLYCRSGNRSGQTAIIMSELGFTNVADVDGGIVEWTGAGHPVVEQ